MATRVLVDRGSWGEADGMCPPTGVDGCTPWVELVASTAGPTVDGAGVAPTGVLGGAGTFARTRPALGTARERSPGALQCLRCQLLGRRQLTCARRDLCLEIPHVYPLGPILLLGWLATAAAFVVSVW
ncbi:MULTISPECIES: hypothetical protein [unclassified Anaeromyxobacter]|uniref:hypothetical protein n=1 Tax=unclassified Anaeromyxobacter TaxID=2620896 RepID=UPI001F5654D6|nr:MULTISPECIES: hypothetical protein [unclassified Anaeromyxobacter]